ncbi:MAG: hypothetical protein WB821_14775, partial [Burkholderiaceae bacterium]
LWIDCTAGALVGVLVFLFSEWLSRLYSMPPGILYFMGSLNLLYAAYSFCLAIRPTRPRVLITLLAAANGTWTFVCLGIATYFFETASFFGIGQLVSEAIFVGGLASLEWKWREQLLSKQPRSTTAQFI